MAFKWPRIPLIWCPLFTDTSYSVPTLCWLIHTLFCVYSLSSLSQLLFLWLYTSIAVGWECVYCMTKQAWPTHFSLTCKLTPPHWHTHTHTPHTYWHSYTHTHTYTHRSNTIQVYTGRLLGVLLLTFGLTHAYRAAYTILAYLVVIFLTTF